MILIEEIIVENTIVRFYNGMDLSKLKNHPKDGSEGFVFCFINKWTDEIKKFNRESKIEQLLENIDDTESFNWKLIENDFISIYQTEGVPDDLIYKTVRNKVLNREIINKTWIPIPGTTNGAFRIK